MVTRSRLLLSAFLLAFAASLTAQSAPKPKPAGHAAEHAADPGKALHAIFDSEWEYGLEQYPDSASFYGDLRWNDKWTDQSLAAIARRHQHDLKLRKKLKAIDRSKLDPTDQTSYDIFNYDNETGIAGYDLGDYLLPVYQREGIQFADSNADQLRFQTIKDYEDWIARMRAFPTYMDQTIGLMQEGLRRGIKHPRVIMERIPAQIERQLVEPEKSGFYAPFKRIPASFSDADKTRLSAAGLAAIKESVLPAYQKFKEFFVGTYLAQSYPEVGVWQYPNGDKYYAHAVRRYTTTDLTPDQIHQIGLDEVKRIHGEMDIIKEKAGFKGTMQEFFTFLRTDPQFFYKTPEELLAAYRVTAKRIDPKLMMLFDKLPRMTYGVDPIPASIAPDTTAAYYNQGAIEAHRPGTFSVNLYKPDSRPKWEMMALAMHESVPGHHLQIALAQEMGDLPKFRRYAYYSSFGEGWGLYAESLGDEMGLYDDPYSKFGQLTYEMWRAVRLVVDTGMHSKHWTRKQAIDYFMENAAKTELDVVNEIDRYIAWPGQALSYKIGQLKIRELRTRATKELGSKFDVREFHNVVLGSGAVPLTILEKNVDEWIAEKKKDIKK